MALLQSTETGLTHLGYSRNHQGSDSMSYLNRITIEAGKRGGKPCIRGLRITVYDILSYLASGMSTDEILSDFPSLSKEDVLASLEYAAERERVTLTASA